MLRIGKKLRNSYIPYPTVANKFKTTQYWLAVNDHAVFRALENKEPIRNSEAEIGKRNKELQTEV